jgi:hypothetical protein
MDMKNTNEMPTVEWFAGLEENRRHKALRVTSMWALSLKPETLEVHLRPHVGQAMNEPVDLEILDQPLREMLERTPLELHGALLAIAEATLVAHLNRLRAQFKVGCPEAYAKAEKEHELFRPFLTGTVQRHVLTSEATRKALWDAAMGRWTPEQQQEVFNQCKQVVRSEYILTKLRSHIRFEY